MENKKKTDVFADIEDERASGLDLRRDRLDDARRGYALIRKVFVQRTSDHEDRSSVLGDLVTGRLELALRTLILVYALEPVLANARWPLGAWAQIVRPSDPPTTEAMSRAFRSLESRQLVNRRTEGRAQIITPLKEDGSGADYERPSTSGTDVGKGYFAVPHDLWNSGLADRLRLPGLSMLLVSLSETSKNDHFQVSLSQMSEWYGISERTAERGYTELSKAGILLTRTQSVRDKTMSSANGLRSVTHRALDGPYSTAARKRAQEIARTASRARQVKDSSE